MKRNWSLVHRTSVGTRNAAPYTVPGTRHKKWTNKTRHYHTRQQSRKPSLLNTVQRANSMAKSIDSKKTWSGTWSVACFIAFCSILPGFLDYVLGPEFPVHLSGAVLISGASSGIGRATCGYLAEKYSDVTFYCGVRKIVQEIQAPIANSFHVTNNSLSVAMLVSAKLINRAPGSRTCTCCYKEDWTKSSRSTTWGT